MAAHPRPASPRLNIWTRAGIVASVVWIAGAGTWRALQVFDDARTASDSAYRSCKALGELLNRPQGCFSAMSHAEQVVKADGWKHVAIAATLPVIVSWVAVGLLVMAARWVMAGRPPTA